MLDELESFDDRPIGTASLAQVHKAVLKDGTVLAIKVQHPRVKAHSFIDMSTMEVHNGSIVFIIYIYII